MRRKLDEFTKKPRRFPNVIPFNRQNRFRVKTECQRRNRLKFDSGKETLGLLRRDSQAPISLG